MKALLFSIILLLAACNVSEKEINEVKSEIEQTADQVKDNFDKQKQKLLIEMKTLSEDIKRVQAEIEAGSKEAIEELKILNEKKDKIKIDLIKLIEKTESQLKKAQNEVEEQLQKIDE